MNNIFESTIFYENNINNNNNILKLILGMKKILSFKYNFLL